MSEQQGAAGALSESKDSLYFIALLPPPDLQERVRVLQREMSDRFASRAALKSPPHITLIPPVSLSEAGARLFGVSGASGFFGENIVSLSEAGARLFGEELQRFSSLSAQNSDLPLSIVLDGFAAFAPRVLYVHVQPSVDLTTLRTQLRDRLQQHPTLKLPANPRHSYAFVPHITVGFRDLSPENFERAWAEFQQRSFQGTFVADALTLLQHNGQHWKPIRSYPLTGIRDF